MFSKITVTVYFVFFVSQTTSLVELPQVDDNSILSTEAVIRDTINSLFYSLKLEGIKDKPRLKKYSTVYNHFISFTLQDYNTLKQIARLTRVDNKNVSNETESFMTVINELLNADIDVTNTDLGKVDDESVFEYVDQFLTRLKYLKEEYGVDSEKYQIKEDVYQILKDDADLFYSNSTSKLDDSLLYDNDTLLGESDFWIPELQTRRVFKGDRTKIKRYPFMASIQIFNKFHCGGCIIKNDLVITASSCLQLAWNNRFFRENPAFLSVRVGSSFYNGGGENIPVLEVYFHPDYNPKNLWNNLCILRLVRKLNFRKKKKRVKKIDFDRQESALPLTTDGITIIGWGARKENNIMNNPWVNVLAYAVLDVYPLRECQEIYSKEYVTKRHFCAGFFSKGGGACNHDVGGPGLANNILTGIVSFGSPLCGTPDAPTVFTKLGFYTDWIESIMEQEVDSYRQRTTLLPPKKALTLGYHYVPVKTTFKIQPVAGTMKPIPLSEVDALRTLASGKMFKEFISTMFGGKELKDYEDLLKDIARMIPKATSDTNLTETQTDGSGLDQFIKHPTPSTMPTEDSLELPTYIDSVDYEMNKNEDAERSTRLLPIIPEESLLEPVTEQNENNVNMNNDNEDIAKMDKNLEELVKLDKHIDNLVKIDQTVEKPGKQEKRESVRNVKGKNIEKDLINLIDDIDLKELIESETSIEEEKLALDERVIKLFNENEVQDKMSKIDDSILTLLYLSDNENVTSKKHDEDLGLEQEYIDGDSDDSDDDDDDEEDSKVGEDGLSIETNQYKDLTYRSGVNITNLLKLLTKEELEELLTKQF